MPPLTFGKNGPRFARRGNPTAARHARAAGEHFESWLHTQFEKAVFMRLISWWRHVGPKIKWVGKAAAAAPRAIGVGPADFIAQAADGRCLVAEAKSRANGIVMYSDIEKHQREHLAACHKAGGIALLFVELREQIKIPPGQLLAGGDLVNRAWAIRRYAVPWMEVPWRVRKHAQGIDAEDLAPWRVETVQVGVDCFLRRFLEAPATPAGR